MRLRTGALMVVVFVLAVFTWGRAAQADRGILSGTIKDAAGVAVPGVTVEARGPMTASALYRRARRLPHPQPRARRLRRHREAGGVRDHDDPGDDLGTERNPPRARDTRRRAAEKRGRGGSRRRPSTPRAGPAGPSTNSRRVHSRFPRPLRRHRRAGEPRRGSFNTEAYDHVDENGFKHVSADPLSTFSMDVDTASYANVRRFLREGQLPPRVRSASRS